MDSENIAAIARAIHEARRQSRFGAQALWEYEPPEITAHYLELAQAALSAIKAQGLVVVPVDVLRPFSIYCNTAQGAKCINKTVGQMEPVTVTVTKAQMLGLTEFVSPLAAAGDA